MRNPTILLQLVLSVAPLLTTYAYTSSDAIIPDYDAVNDMFYNAEEMRQKRSVAGTTDSELGGSGATTSPELEESSCAMGSASCTVTPGTDAPDVDLIENCTLPDRVCSCGEEEATARFRGICHSLCLQKLDGSLAASTRQMLLGYPIWIHSFLSFKFSEDGIRGVDCLLPQNPNECRVPDGCSGALNKLLDCQRGCVTRLQGFVDDCGRQCRSNCKMDCDKPSSFDSAFGCSSKLLPSRICNIICRGRDCKSGCESGEGYLINSLGTTAAPYTNVYPTDIGEVTFQPTGPPAVNHIFGTRYSVNISSAVPVVPRHLEMLVDFGFTTTIIRVDGQAATRFYVLDRSTEVNLELFACQTVNITFQVATAIKGFSNFSRQLQMDVMNVEVNDRDYPDQLNASTVRINVSEDERINFFQYYVINISWDLPNNHQFAEGYFISMKSFAICGQVTVFINDTNVTSHTFQVTPAERVSGTPVPPISSCSYDLEIEVFPRNLLRQDKAFSETIHTGMYSTPSKDDLFVNCSAALNLASSNYDITLRMRYCTVFTPAVFSAINSIYITRFELGVNGNVVPDGNGAMSENMFEHIDNTVTLPSLLTYPLDPLPLEHSYKFFFAVKWKFDLPRTVPFIQFDCVISDLEPIPLDPINKENITIISQVLIARGEEVFKADVEYNFTFVRPENRQMQKGFDVWFSDSLAPENNDDITITQRLGANKTSGRISELLTITSNSTKLYLQLRAYTLQTISNWGTPLALIFTLDSTRPKAVTDENFNITQFSFSTSPGEMNDVIVTVALDIEHDIKSDVSSASFEVWLGTEQLLADQRDVNQDFVRPFSVETSNYSNYESSLTLPALGVLLYLQIRAINKAKLPGNWSSPEVFNVEEIPPPVIEDGPPLSDIIPLRNGDGELTSFKFTLEIDFSNKPTDDPTTTNISTIPPISSRRKREAVLESGMVVTHFGIAIGFEPVNDTYGKVPSSSVENMVEVGEGPVQITNEIAVDVNDFISNVTLLLQIRSVAGGAYGMWSEPIYIPVDIELVVMKSSVSVLILTAIPFAIIAAITIAIIVALVIFFCYKQYKFRVKFTGDAGGPWTVDDPDPPFMVKRKDDFMVDVWEIPTMEVIVEDYLGEGAFGLVFKGMIRGPLRNPKLSAKLKQTIGLPIAIKLLKDTASRKERSDFLVEIDMMKKISEGYCPNIVNMVGCVTSQEPLCLITEFVPHGDLLDYLRNQRKKSSSRQREEKNLRGQLQQQRKAYEEMKRKMEILQSGQEVGEGRLTTGSSGYAGFSDIGSFQSHGGDGDMSDEPQQEQQQQQLAIPPQGNVEESNSFQFSNQMFGEDSDREEAEEKDRPASSFMEGMMEDSHLDPLPSDDQEEDTVKEKDIYADLGDLDANDLMQFAYQIATGMEYLSSINIVHRDLACRNVLVGEGKNLKITDFGLSREVEEVYVKTTKGRLPLKWMALESIEAREFTTQSDVWSYGVTLWEIGTMGGFPYPTIQNQDLLMMIKQGYRLEKPENCAAEVYSIMLECWQEHPIDRPNFPELRKKFSDLLACTGDSYMVLQIDDSKIYYTVDEVEEKNCKGSEESLSSTDSIKKAKNKKIEKPRWAQDANAYALMPSTFKEEQDYFEDEHYHHNSTSAAIGLEEKQTHFSTVVTADVTDAPIFNGIPEEEPNVLGSSQLPLQQNISLPAAQTTLISLDDQVGIPLSFVMGSSEKQTGQDALHNGKDAKKSKNNPYVDDPKTLLPLEEIKEDRMLSEGQLAQNPSSTAELNSKKLKVVRRGDEEDVTIM